MERGRGYNLKVASVLRIGENLYGQKTAPLVASCNDDMDSSQQCLADGQPGGVFFFF